MKQPLTFRPHGFKQTITLLTGVSSIALFTGCSLSEIKNPFGSQRPEQQVVGERRMPVYNQANLKQEAVVQPALPTMLVPPQAPVANAVTAEQMKSDPYDYYGAAASTSVPPPSGAEQPLGSLNPAPVKVEGKPLVRKPLPENPRNTPDTVAPQETVASNAIMPASDVAVAQPVAEQAQETASDHPVAEASAGRPSFFQRLFGPSAKKTESDNSPPPWKAREETTGGTTLSEDEKNAPYAPLSSVPPVPSEFKADLNTKANRQDAVQDLQNERDQALQQKQLLNGEPSQQQNVTPVEMPPISAQATPGVVKPAENNPVPPLEASPNMSVPPQSEPRMPRRGIDIMTQEEWDTMQKARAEARSVPQQSLPDTGPVSPAGPDVTPPQPDQSFTPAPALDSVPGQSPLPVPEEKNAPSQGSSPQSSLPDVHPSFFARIFGAPHPDTDTPPAGTEAAVEKEPAAPTSNDWLQTLVSDSQAQTEATAGQQPATEAAKADTAVAPKLIGEMSDREALQTAQPVAPSLDTLPAVDAKAAAEAEKTPETVADESAVAISDSAPGQATPVQRPAFFSRLFSGTSTPAEAGNPPSAATEEKLDNLPPQNMPNENAEAVQPAQAKSSQQADTSVTAAEVEKPLPPAPAVVMAAEPPATVPPFSQRPSLLMRLFSKESESAPQDQPVPDNTPPVLPQVEGNADKPLPPAALSPSAGVAAPAPELISASAPVTAVTADDTAGNSGNDAAAGTASSLPSPHLLQEIKMMPASRYSSRAQAIKQPTEDY